MLLVEYSTSIIAGYQRPKSHDPRAHRQHHYRGSKRPATSVTRQPRSNAILVSARPKSCVTRSSTSVSTYPSSCTFTRDNSPSSQEHCRPTSSMTVPPRSRACLLRQRKMTRSAPPARTSSPAKHTSGSHARNTRSRDTSSAISIGDIYQSAEKERINYSTLVRRQNLAHAQSQTQFFRHDQSSSRPNTSRTVASYRPDLNTPVNAWSEPNLSRPGSILPNAELQALVYEDEDDDGEFDMAHHTQSAVSFTSPVSRDCCEIIGPQMCYECRKNRIRQVNRERADMFFPLLQPSEEHLTTAAIVRKYLPGLSDPEIEDKIARGEINRPSIRKQNRHVEFDDEDNEPRHKPHNKRVTIVERESEKKKVITERKPSELYFTNIRDLNSKIIRGKVERNVGFTRPDGSAIVRKKSIPSKNMYPAFVSPRKVKLVQDTNYKTYFTPPLIEKAKQDVEPAFFAGSSGTYKLPEKLPDELVFVDKDGNEMKASESKGFTAKLSAASEGKAKDDVDNNTNLKEPVSNDREHLFSLNEDEEEEEEEQSNEVNDNSSDSKNESNEDDSDSRKESNQNTVDVNVKIVLGDTQEDSDKSFSSDVSN